MCNVNTLLSVVVEGEFACFTNPQFKVERVSYPIITPSAARGILEAIFWKPEISWEIREIHLLKEIKYFSILRNEVSSVAARKPIFIEDKRTQRSTLALRDVSYLIKAEFKLKPHLNSGSENDLIVKYKDQFLRRVTKGQCFHQPSLGCREFAATFRPPTEKDVAINYTADLGLILFDMIYTHVSSEKSLSKKSLNDLNNKSFEIKPYHGIAAKPIFFSAKIENGILKIPSDLYEKVNV